MMIFKVLKPGLFTTIQDLGRHCYLEFGVPVSGAMDNYSLTAANLLVENDPNSACLEATLAGPELQTLKRTEIAVTGGECSPKINSQSSPMWQTLNLEEGDIVSFDKMERGCRAYIAIRGGINIPLVLGSRSTYARGGFGGMHGRPLKTGDVIEGFDVSPLKAQYEMPSEMAPQFPDNINVNVILGPQTDMFTEKGIETFLSSQYTVTSEADRMGYRLEGPVIEHKTKVDIISDALLPGAIQVPKNGKPILIMRDAQTTGGYPKIAVVTSPDLDLVGQAKPNVGIEFVKVTIRQAHDKLSTYAKLLNTLTLTFKRKT
jgi:biotin-dependent carboxylase-like uncharacterized protein